MKELKDIPFSIMTSDNKSFVFHEHIDLEEYPTEILLGDKIYVIKSVTTTDRKGDFNE